MSFEKWTAQRAGKFINSSVASLHSAVSDLPFESLRLLMADSNTEIVYPTVPPGEEGPRARVNVMIDIFNASLPSRNPPGGIDSGFLHEIYTARKLVMEHKITHGRQISRPLNAAEKRSGHNGASQMIKVPMEGNHFRELDMVYEEKGRVHIVEAKNTRTVDTSQVEANMYLAMALLHPATVVYALENKNASQDKALRKAHENVASHQPFYGWDWGSFDVIHIPQSRFSRGYFEGYYNSLDHMHIGFPVWNDGNGDAGDEPDYESDPAYT